MSIKQLIIQYEKLLSDKKANVLKSLQKGLKEKEILFAIKSTSIPNNVKSMYESRNGIPDSSDLPIEELEYFPDGIMLSLDSAIENFNITRNGVKKSLFPLFTDGGGSLFLIETDSKDENYLMILYYSPSLLLSENPVTIYDSLEKLFETIVKCLVSGAYFINENGTFEVDYDLKYEISEEMNPNSKYWTL